MCAPCSRAFSLGPPSPSYHPSLMPPVRTSTPVRFLPLHSLSLELHGSHVSRVRGSACASTWPLRLLHRCNNCLGYRGPHGHIDFQRSDSPHCQPYYIIVWLILSNGYGHGEASANVRVRARVWGKRPQARGTRKARGAYVRGKLQACNFGDVGILETKKIPRRLNRGICACHAFLSVSLCRVCA